jgi:hypothetical protein
LNEEFSILNTMAALRPCGSARDSCKITDNSGFSVFPLPPPAADRLEFFPLAKTSDLKGDTPAVYEEAIDSLKEIKARIDQAEVYL